MSDSNDVVTCEIKLFWNKFEIISVFYFLCNHAWNYLKIISAPKLFQNNFRRGYMWNETLKLFQNYFKIILFHM